MKGDLSRFGPPALRSGLVVLLITCLPAPMHFMSACAQTARPTRAQDAAELYNPARAGDSTALLAGAQRDVLLPAQPHDVLRATKLLRLGMQEGRLSPGRSSQRDRHEVGGRSRALQDSRHEQRALPPRSSPVSDGATSRKSWLQRHWPVLGIGVTLIGTSVWYFWIRDGNEGRARSAPDLPDFPSPPPSSQRASNVVPNPAPHTA